MGNWRFYAQRPDGLWLDNNVQIGDMTMTWNLSGPGTGKGLIPSGMNDALMGSDGQPQWGKWNTLLLGEEDGKLSWAGVCTGANPDKAGLHLEFVDPFGWLAKVPFRAEYTHWKTNIFDVCRALVTHANAYSPGFDFVTPNGDSVNWIGDPQPPAKPKEPGRKKGETKTQYYNSKRYKDYKDDITDWNTKYADKRPFTIAWWEAPFVGEEFDQMAKEFDFDYRMRYAWADAGKKIARYYLDFEDNLRNRREDIKFVDGINIAAPLDPKDGETEFANFVIGLGAGEGRKMARIETRKDDGRYFQASYSQYKSIKDLTRLRNLSNVDLRNLNNKDPKIDNVVAWDMPGYADLSTLRCGDEVQVISQNLQPNLNLWGRVRTLTRSPYDSTIVVTLEVVA